MKRVLIIAEAGVNHNGSLDLAYRLIDAAVRAGADIVKFQTFRAELLSTRLAQKADYQILNMGTGESQFEMLKKLELSENDHFQLKAYAAQKKIEFLSTPFDEASAEFLARKIEIKRFKIPSGEITNLPFLEFVSDFGLPVILSTGMSDLDEIQKAVEALTKKLPLSQITLLHCTTSYPCAFADVHLRALATIQKAFKVPVGYSDHTLGIEIAVAAVALGAEVIEKHLALDRSLPGPDHKTSLEPDEFKQLVAAIRNTEQALGSPEKKPTEGELKIRETARKSLAATTRLPKGTVLAREHLIAKRPGHGISPAELDALLGRKLKNAKAADEVLTWSDVEGE